MCRLSVGCEGKLAALKHAFPQFPTDSHHIWQRPNAEFKINVNGNGNGKTHSLCS
ncbi:hypothetical protein [Paraherbaspirillum soli]|uniref:Uncharacterized protein n=1 Tax=Paraherbaspirillum soli TaxID=631222 RepID=A0ABW0MGE0_9BURK